MKKQWEVWKTQEKDLKEKFYNAPFEQRAAIKRELTTLQKTMFDKKWSCWKSMSIDIKHEEMMERLKTANNPSDPKYLASLIKDELQATLNGSKAVETGDTCGDIWESNHGQEFCYFGANKVVNELIANLPRKRQKPLDSDRITTRMVRVKREDLSTADFDEIISLIRQVTNYLEEKDKQERKRIENIKNNNPQLFTQWKCSTDGKHNGRGAWEKWHTFSGKRNGISYTIYVPDNHLALTNCLFDDGWGTNSEVSKFFVVEGVIEPTEIHYWNVEKQRSEIISLAEAQNLKRQEKDAYINYQTYVGLNDKISICHYQENEQDQSKLPAELVGGINKELSENNNQGEVAGGSLVASETKSFPQLLLDYFQKRGIEKITLTPERNLLVEYQNKPSEIIIGNQLEEKKILAFFQTNAKNSLSRQELTAMLGNINSSLSVQNDNNYWKIGLGIGGVLVVGIVIRIFLRKRNLKKH